MNPYLFHLCIIAVLMIPGIASFLMEFFSEQTVGGLIQKYTFTKLYWTGFAGYAGISTFIVLCVHLLLKVYQKRFTRLSVFLSHIIPVGIVWVSLALGIHDFIQSKWEQRTNTKKDHLTDSIIKKPNQKPPIPQTPVLKQMPLKASDSPIQQQEQRSSPDPTK